MQIDLNLQSILKCTPLDVNSIRLDVCSLSYLHDNILEMERSCHSPCKFNPSSSCLFYVWLGIYETFLEHSHIKLYTLIEKQKHFLLLDSVILKKMNKLYERDYELGKCFISLTN